jgi:hypothetical protein
MRTILAWGVGQIRSNPGKIYPIKKALASGAAHFDARLIKYKILRDQPFLSQFVKGQ